MKYVRFVWFVFKPYLISKKHSHVVHLFALFRAHTHTHSCSWSFIFLWFGVWSVVRLLGSARQCVCVCVSVCVWVHSARPFARVVAHLFVFMCVCAYSCVLVCTAETCLWVVWGGGYVLGGTSGKVALRLASICRIVIIVFKRLRRGS